MEKTLNKYTLTCDMIEREFEYTEDNVTFIHNGEIDSLSDYCRQSVDNSLLTDYISQWLSDELYLSLNEFQVLPPSIMVEQFDILAFNGYGTYLVIGVNYIG